MPDYYQPSDHITMLMMGEILKGYYSGKVDDDRITKALEELEDEPYYCILPMYYKYGYGTIPISMDIYLDESNVKKNKKKLLLKLWHMLYESDT